MGLVDASGMLCIASMHRFRVTRLRPSRAPRWRLDTRLHSVARRRGRRRTWGGVVGGWAGQDRRHEPGGRHLQQGAALNAQCRNCKGPPIVEMSETLPQQSTTSCQNGFIFAPTALFPRKGIDNGIR